MVRKKRKSPLDWTERQTDNFLVLVGTGIVIWWAARDFTPDNQFLGFIAAILIGKKLVKFGKDSDDEEVSQLVKKTKQNNQRNTNRDVDPTGSNKPGGNFRVLSVFKR